MKEILLTQDKITLVDDEDYEWLNQWKWCTQKGKYTSYAMRGVWDGQRERQLRMHREILGLSFYDGKLVDHKNRNGLDNRRENLRLATTVINAYNCKKRVDNSSGFRGVHWCNTRGKWITQISIGKLRKKCGSFNDPILAAMAYDQAAMKYKGDDAILNFPKETFHEENTR
jgi:hypothetical protein